MHCRKEAEGVQRQSTKAAVQWTVDSGHDLGLLQCKLIEVRVRFPRFGDPSGPQITAESDFDDKFPGSANL